jgi:hypothetical protein
MAGKVVNVTLPKALLPYASSIAFQIGCHTDGIWDKTEWTRMPEMVRWWVVGARAAPAASRALGLRPGSHAPAKGSEPSRDY